MPTPTQVATLLYNHISHCRKTLIRKNHAFPENENKHLGEIGF